MNAPMNAHGRILVVDDDEHDREITRSVLAKEGFEVITASDGREALQKARTERPDLVVLDVVMPEQGGWDTCDALREADGSHSLKILFLTQVEVPRTLYAAHVALETDWDEYLTKPVTPRKLIAAVRQLLGKSSASHPPMTPNPR